MKAQPTLLQKSLNLWAIILILWSLYRTKFQFPEWFDEFLAKPILFVLPVLIFIKRVEKTNILDSIWLSKKNIRKETKLSYLIGFLFLSTILVSNFFKYGSFVGNLSLSALKTIGYLALFSFATAISEEILSRGLILNKLYQESKNVYTSSAAATLLFIILHVPILFTNLKLSGFSLIFYIITLTILSLANSFIYLDRKNLSLPILIHGFYNLAISLYI